jgi:hypothetical protein
VRKQAERYLFIILRYFYFILAGFDGTSDKNRQTIGKRMVHFLGKHHHQQHGTRRRLYSSFGISDGVMMSPSKRGDGSAKRRIVFTAKWISPSRDRRHPAGPDSKSRGFSLR